MEVLNKLFFKQKMSWPKVIIGAVIVAIVTAALLVIPGVKDTSLSYIGVNIECWVLFALIIIMNCERALEAGLKTFVFFLISQPLIYLLQVPFSHLGWSLFQFYPRWGIYTVLCFPVAMLAWTIKKNKWWGGIILAIATCFLGYELATYIKGLVDNFPHGLIATIFTALLIVVLIFTILKDKIAKIICAVATLVMVIAACLIIFISSAAQTLIQTYDLGVGSSWKIISQDGYIGEINFEGEDPSSIEIVATQPGESIIEFENEKGESITLKLTYQNHNLKIEEVK